LTRLAQFTYPLPQSFPATKDGAVARATNPFGRLPVIQLTDRREVISTMDRGNRRTLTTRLEKQA
jgi:hypothetical protein